MRRILIVLFSLCITPLLTASKHCCPDPEVLCRLQEMQRCIDTIKSKVCKTQESIIRIDTEIDNLSVNCSGIEDLEIDISILGETLCSKIENISVEATCSGIEDLEIDISLLGETLCSKLENIESTVDACCPSSQLDVIESKIDTCCPASQLDIIESTVDACCPTSQLDVIESKIDTCCPASQLDVIESAVDACCPTSQLDVIESKIDTCCPTSQLDVIESKLDALETCAATRLSSADVVNGGIILSSSGNYCLAEDLTATVTISADCVSLDLNNRCLTGEIFVSSDDVELKNGNVTPAAPTAEFPDAAITISSTSDRARISDVLIICTDSATDGVSGRDGIEVDGNDTQIFNTTVKSGSGDSGTTGTSGGRGIFLGEVANNVIISNCFISTGDGGNGSSGDGGDGGNGISIEGATETEVTNTTILFTGNGGNGAGGGSNGDGGHAVYITSGSLDTVIRNCSMRNTGAAGTGGSGGVSGRAIEDEVTTVADLSMCYSNFAHNIANSVKYNLQATGVEQGVAIANPPTATVVNPFANVFVS